MRPEAADEPRLRGILFALGKSSLADPAFPSQLRAYLTDERPMIVAEAIDALRRQQSSEAFPDIVDLRRHVSPYVRGAVLRFVASMSPETARNLLIEALKDPDYIVRENAVDELGELNVADALPHLYPLLTDSHPHVRQAAQTTIKMLNSESLE